MNPDTLKQWRARLGLGEQGMAVYVGVPVNTWKKWENGTRTPDAAPLRLMSLLQRIETDAPAMHADLMQTARIAPPDAPKRGRRGKGAPTTDTAPAADPGRPATHAAPDPWVHVADALPDWMKSGTAPL